MVCTKLFFLIFICYNVIMLQMLLHILMHILDKEVDRYGSVLSLVKGMSIS